LLAGTFNEIKLTLPAFLQTTEESLREAENKYVGPEHRHRKLYACIETSVRALNPALRSLLSGLRCRISHELLGAKSGFLIEQSF